MNRNEEYITLKEELEHTPPELEYLATKAVLRAKKRKRLTLLWKAPMVSFCSLALIFVLLVNMLPKVALAMSDVPFLRELVSAVAMNPSLKQAVENDYVQIINQSQTIDDVTVTVEYMIPDAGHISLFYRVDSPVQSGETLCDLRNTHGEVLQAVTSWDTLYETGKLEELQIDFVDEAYPIPGVFTLHITVNKNENYGEQMSQQGSNSAGPMSPSPTVVPAYTGGKYEFYFVLHPDQSFSKTGTTVPIDQWITIKGQNIYLEKLEVYPSNARLYLDFDENNSALIEELDITFEDENGNLYRPKGNGLSMSGAADSFDIRSLYFESNYFSESKHLKLNINGISMIEKDEMYGEINYSDKTITNIPEGVTIDQMELIDHSLNLSFKVHSDRPDHVKGVLSSLYYDDSNNEYSFESWSTDKIDDIYYPHYTIKDFEDHKFKFRWIYSPMQTLTTPVVIDVK
jgi:hypothetical protein